MCCVLVASTDKKTKECLLRSIPKGYSPKVVEDSSGAVLGALDEKVDLIIIDLEIKGGFGLETIDIIKKSKPTVPLVVVSGNSSIDTGREVMERGVFYYLLKPNSHEFHLYVQKQIDQQTRLCYQEPCSLIPLGV